MGHLASVPWETVLSAAIPVRTLEGYRFSGSPRRGTQHGHQRRVRGKGLLAGRCQARRSLHGGFHPSRNSHRRRGGTLVNSVGDAIHFPSRPNGPPDFFEWGEHPIARTRLFSLLSRHERGPIPASGKAMPACHCNAECVCPISLLCWMFRPPRVG